MLSRRCLLSLIAGLMVMPLTCSAEAIFSPLPETSLQQFRWQRVFVSELLAKHFPRQKLMRSREDFALLQQIIDAKLILSSNKWQSQALGVVFGDALAAAVPGLAWCQVSDEFGVDSTLRYRDTTLQVNALTILSKRIERGEAVRVAFLAQEVAEFVAKRAEEFK